MDDNVYIDYYLNQQGGHLPHFRGFRYQRGGAFFGRVFKSVLQPLLRYLGKRALTGAVATGQDLLEGKSFKESATSALKSMGTTMATDLARKLSQSGSGGRKRKMIAFENAFDNAPPLKRRKRVRKKDGAKKRAGRRKIKKTKAITGSRKVTKRRYKKRDSTEFTNLKRLADLCL